MPEQRETLEDWCARRRYKLEDALPGILIEYPDTWLPVTDRRNVTTVDALLAQRRPIGWGFQSRYVGGVVEARAVRVDRLERPRGWPRSAADREPLQDWEVNLGDQVDSLDIPVVFDGGVPILAGSEHDPRL